MDQCGRIFTGRGIGTGSKRFSPPSPIFLIQACYIFGEISKNPDKFEKKKIVYTPTLARKTFLYKHATGGERESGRGIEGRDRNTGNRTRRRRRRSIFSGVAFGRHFPAAARPRSFRVFKTAPETKSRAFRSVFSPNPPSRAQRDVFRSPTRGHSKVFKNRLDGPNNNNTGALSYTSPLAVEVVRFVSRPLFSFVYRFFFFLIFSTVTCVYVYNYVLANVAARLD